MEIFVTRRNDLKGMDSPAAPAAVLGSLTAFPKAGSAQDSQRTAEELVKFSCIYRFKFCGIKVHEAGTFIRSSLPNSRHLGHFNWGIRAERVVDWFAACNYCRIKLPLKRACPEDALKWIPHGWKHSGKRPFLRERIIGCLT